MRVHVVGGEVVERTERIGGADWYSGLVQWTGTGKPRLVNLSHQGGFYARL